MNIHRLVTGVDDNGTPLGIIAVNNSDLKGVSFFYDQDGILEWLSSEYTGSLEAPVAREFVERIQQSNLPKSHSFMEPFVIPNYAGACLANAIDVYYRAMSQQFRPHQAWPVTNQVAGYSYITYMYTLDPDEDIESLGGNLEYFNCLFGFLESEKECSVHLVNSKLQLLNLVRNANLLDENVREEILVGVSNVVIPEYSDEPAIKLETCIARYIYRMMSYRHYMMTYVRSLGGGKWDSQNPQPDSALN